MKKTKDKTAKEETASIFAGPEFAMPNFFKLKQKKPPAPQDNLPTVTQKKNPK